MLFKKISDILSLSVLIIELIGVIIFVFLKIFFNVYVIASPSMDPILKVGDVIISKKYSGNINDLEEEDIITYMGRVDSYKGKLITHEIVSIDYDNNVIYTKGINNSNIDPIVKNEDIKSVFIHVSPILTVLYNAISNKIIRIIIITIVFILIIYNFFRLLFNRRTNHDKK